MISLGVIKKNPYNSLDAPSSPHIKIQEGLDKEDDNCFIQRRLISAKTRANETNEPVVKSTAYGIMQMTPKSVKNKFFTTQVPSAVDQTSQKRRLEHNENPITMHEEDDWNLYFH